MIAALDPVEVLHRSRGTSVTRCRHRDTGQMVLVKQVGVGSELDKLRARLRFEHHLLTLLAGQGARNVVRPVELLEDQGTCNLLLEDIGGISLSAALRDGPLSLLQTAQVAAAVSLALTDVHRSHIVHKDVNPNNIVANFATNTVQLIDFNIASQLRRETQAVDNLRTLEGTPPYLSPEQTGRMNRALDYRSDFYSLGVTLYELLAKQLPFGHADIAELVHAILTQRPPSLAELAPQTPAPLVAVIAKAMAKVPEERYVSAQGLHHDLQHCLTLIARNQPVEPFELATADRSERFDVPQKLYGREHDVATTLATYLRVAEGSFEMLFASGPSGIGKSILINEVQPLIVQNNGLFAAGKYDQLRRHIPFGAFSQAIASLVRRLLMEPDAQLAAWRNRVQAAVGRVGQALVDIAPTIERLIGPQAPLPELGPQENENRLITLLLRFISALCEKQPLVLFLDDVQWADASTLKLLNGLVGEARSMPRLLLVAAYRDNEVGPDHPLRQVITDAGRAGIPVQQVHVEPLSRDDLQTLLSDATYVPAAQTADLAELLQQKTGGNPFFVREFIGYLVDKELLVYQPERRHWMWDLPAIRAAEVTNNVVALMQEKLRHLSADAAQTLSFAACVGGEFTLSGLGHVLQKPLADVAASLHVPLEQGFVLPQGNDYRYAATSTSGDVSYKFAHDRIRQAAYELLPAATALQVRLQIAQRLLEQLDQDTPEKWVFSVLDHFNVALPIIEDLALRRHVAWLNWIGAKEARRAAAYAVAVECLQAGLRALPDDPWVQHHQLARDLYLELTEAELLVDDMDNAQLHLDLVLAKSTHVFDRAMVYYRRVLILVGRDLYSEGIEAGAQGLQLLGIDFNYSSKLHVMRSVLAFRWAMRRRTPEQLENAPDITDPRMTLALDILSAIPNAAYLVNTTAFVLAAFKAGSLVLKYGNSRASSMVFVVLSIVYSIQGKHPEAEAFGSLATRLVKKRTQSIMSGGSYFGKYAWSGVMRCTPQELEEKFTEGYQASLEGGDLFNGRWNLLALLRAVFWYSLPRTASLFVQYEEPLSRIQAREVRIPLAMVKQLARCLAGETAGPTRLDDAEFDESEVRAYADLRSSNSRASSAYYSQRTAICYLHDDLPAACAAAETAMRSRVLMASPQHVALPFAAFAALSFLRRAQQQGDLAPLRGPWFKGLQKYLQVARINNSPITLGISDLVNAELRHVQGNRQSLAESYEQACSLLAQSGYTSLQAVAHECAGRYLLTRHCQTAADAHLQRARDLFAAWGATLKVERLEAEFTATVGITPMRFADTPATALGTSTARTGRITTAMEIDLPAIIEVSQALSSEVVLDKLVTKIIDSMRQCSGASRAVLLVGEGANPTMIPSTVAAPPAAVVQYVLRTREPVVINNIATQRDFPDARFSGQAQSLMCAPIEYQGKIKGVIYLENDMMVDAFFAERLTVVKLLAAQAAIALENGAIYANLEQVVQQRTADLREAHAKLLRLTQDSTESQMAGGFAHEMRNALASACMLLSNIWEDTEEDRDFPGTMQSIESLIPVLQRLSDAPSAPPEIAAELNELRATLQRELDEGNESLRGISESLARGMLLTTKTLEYASARDVIVGDHAIWVQDVVDDVLGDLAADLAANAVITEVHIPTGMRFPMRHEHACIILRNLLVNARDALSSSRVQERRITISASVTATTSSFAVADTGAGMSEVVASRVFQPFFSTKGVHGTGLGLGLSRKLARAYGGDVSFSSTQDHGAIFQVTLPRIAG